MLAAPTVSAQTDEEVDGDPSAETAPFPSTGFAPKTPAPKEYDWIQLSSREWLKGDLLRLRREVVEFDSDELDDDAVESWALDASFETLSVVSVDGGGADDEVGEVEFVVGYIDERGEGCRHHERSRFRRSEGRWYFVEGELIKEPPVVREGPKMGRNDPCSCGSGKKYKRCCGARA